MDVDNMAIVGWLDGFLLATSIHARHAKEEFLKDRSYTGTI